MKREHHKKVAIIIIAILVVLVTLGTAYFFLSTKNKNQEQEPIKYGVSFNTLYVRELNLEPKEVFDVIVDDLGVKHFRLAAHWNMVEPENGVWDFSELDYQVEKSLEAGADIIMGVGRRLPRWPECHVPDWASSLDWEDQKKEIREYIEVVIDRYKDYDHIINWQVENEPFLGVFATEHCGKLDVDFLDEEIALVKSLDSDKGREILITDSGNLGLWARPYKRGDLFGTSVYVYLWNPDIGPFKSFLKPSFYRFKSNVMKLLFGDKETLLIELSLEPWLLQPVVDTSIDIQLERMDINKFTEIVDFAKETQFQRQYLWGAEWWYFMKKNDHPEFWNEAKEVFGQSN